MEGAGWSRVTHPFATVCAPEGALPVRLACVKHAASVHPEPGSNSPLKYRRDGGRPPPAFARCILGPSSCLGFRKLVEPCGVSPAGVCFLRCPLTSNSSCPQYPVLKVPSRLSGRFRRCRAARGFIIPAPRRRVKGFFRKTSAFRSEAPCMSATSCPPTAWRRSTFGDGRLNCRVRNGFG